jgi:hypothetical protein
MLENALLVLGTMIGLIVLVADARASRVPAGTTTNGIPRHRRAV